jgi:hypothetical protein
VDNTVDFGFVPNSSLNTLGNQVWADGNNNGLLDGAEAGINGVRVNLYFDLDGNGAVDPSERVLPYRTILTSGNGNYTFGSLPPGAYVAELPATNFTGAGALVSALLSSTVTVTNDNRVDGDDNGSQPGGAGTVVTSPLTVLGIGEVDFALDFGFVPNTSLASVGNQVWHDTSRDGLLNGAETGLNGVLMHLYLDLDGNGTVDLPERAAPYRSTTTVGNGFYGFASLPPGRYVIELPATNFTGAGALVPTPAAATPAVAVDNGTDHDSNGLQDGGPGTVTVSPQFTLSPGENDPTQDFGFVAVPPTMVSGHVYYDTNGNGAQGGGEPNLTNVPVTVTFGTNLVIVNTDPNGHWSAVVAPGWVTNKVNTGAPSFLAQVPLGWAQTEGTDPTATNAPAGVTTSLGNDGYFWAPPTLGCATNKSVECGLAWSFDPPGYTNGTCGGATLSVLSTTTNPVCGNAFTATRTWSVRDPCGYSNTCSQTVTVRDTTPPALVCVGNKTVECGTAWSFDPPGASDACGTNVVQILSTTTNFTCGNTFSMTRTWRATDTCTNSATCSQTVTVQDNTPPAVTVNPGADTTIECPAAPVFSPPTFVDACAGPVTPSVATVTNTVGCSNLLTRTWTATDACGNTTNRSQTITVRDTTAPTIICPPNLTLTANAGGCQATNVALGAPAAGDLCGPVTVTHDAPAAFPCGTNVVQWVVVDACGHSNTCRQTVTVVPAGPALGTLTGQVQLQGFIGTGTLPQPHRRVMTFIATTNHPAGTNVLQTWTLTLTNVSGDTFTYARPDVPPTANALSVKTDWNLRRKLPFTFDPNAQAVAHFTGANFLRAADLTGDNAVNLADYTQMLTHWLEDVSLTPAAAVADMNGDGKINVLDYSLLGQNWFTAGDPE